MPPNSRNSPSIRIHGGRCSRTAKYQGKQLASFVSLPHINRMETNKATENV